MRANRGENCGAYRQRTKILADEPVSRILCAARPSRGLAPALHRPTQRDDHSSRSGIAPGLQQPTRGSPRRALASGTLAGRASPPLLFGLAPRGVFRAPDVATRAVGSYPTFSPLPNALDLSWRVPGFPSDLPQWSKHHRRFIFCGTFRSRRKILRSCQWQHRRGSRDNPLALPGALPNRSPDFPPAPDCRAGDHPAHPPPAIITHVCLRACLESITTRTT